MRVLQNLLAFNRGIISRLALARLDFKRTALSAEIMVNWMPRVLGSMMLRPGLAWIGITKSNARMRPVPFVFSTDDTALIELTDNVMRVRIDDVLITRPAITSSFFRWNTGTVSWDASADITSEFVDATEVSYWRDNDESGATSAVYSSPSYLSLLGSGTASAIRDRKVDVVEANVEHSIQITVTRGNLIVRIGSTEGGDEYLTDRVLRPGRHSLSVTPTADFYIRLGNYRNIATLVDVVSIGQAATGMELATPWDEDDIPNVRWIQSGDVLFCACKGIAQKRIERQGAGSPRSWSIVDYLPEDGPLGDLNTGPTRIKVSALTGDADLTAERAFLKETHEGALFSMVSAGQEVSSHLVAENTFTDPIRVTGVGNSRTFTVTLSGTFTATTTVVLQRSVAAPGDWTDQGTAWTAATTSPITDGLDNQIIYYRVGIKTGDYTVADDVVATLTYSAGSITGIIRINRVTSGTAAKVSILKALGKADQYTQDWREGDWSPRKGYPSAVTIADGRLMWAGKSMTWGSISDQYDSFDDSVEGDSAPIRKTIGSGPVDTVAWLIDSSNLVIGLQGSAQAARSSSLDEPLTQTRFTWKRISSKGAALLQAITVDTSVVWVGRNRSRVYEATYDNAGGFAAPSDLTAVVPELGLPGLRAVAVQENPDTRIHFIRDDGTACLLVRDRVENVTCWLTIETDGEIEDVAVLPGTTAVPQEDRVYYVVKRTIDGAEVRYLEKFALESQARGTDDNRIGDSHVTGTGTATTILTGMDHIEGETVCLWGNSKDLGTYTVVGGQIAASEAITGPWCAGLEYEALWKSGKLLIGHDQNGLGKKKAVGAMTLVAADLHAQGLQYGVDLDFMDDLPLVEEGAVVDPDSIWASYDYSAITVNGTYAEDTRLYLKAQAPRPATVLAVCLE